MTDNTINIDDDRVDLLWYEGDEDNAASFIADMKARYGFDPSIDPNWDETESGRGFRCPTWEIRQAVHDDERYWEDPWFVGC
jgi:hypothetical protein